MNPLRTQRRPPINATALILLVVLVAALWVLPADAMAGTYDVYSCDVNHGGGATPSWSAFESPGMTAYGNCVGGQPEGLVARTVAAPNATSSGFQNAYVEFSAPAGTTIDSIHAYFYLSRLGCNWSAGLRASNGDLGSGSWVFALQSGYCGTNGWDWTYFDWPINASNAFIAVVCGASSCDRSSETRAAIRGVRITINDPTPPTLSDPRGSMWNDGAWLAGSQDVAFDASDGAGIRHDEVQIDGQMVRADNHVCDDTLAASCPNGGMAATIDTSKVTPDGPHQLTLETIDTAGNPTQVSKTINVDNTPPKPPTGLAIGGGDGWRTSNDFSVSWTNPDPDGGAPISAAMYSLCPAGGGPCVNGSQAGDAINSLSHLQVPSAGDWTLSAWLRDGAGNASPANAAAPVHLRFDDSAPTIAFEPRNPSDPTLVSALASDAVSGVSQGKIEIRRHGSTTWRELASSYDGTRITARIDDSQLAAGPYDLQAWAVDAAGNEKTTQQFAGGATAHIRLPLRVRTHIFAGASARNHKGRRQTWRTSIHVPFGKPARLAGRLLTADRNPIAASTILVYERQQRTGATWTPVASLTTSRRGYFAYRVPKGPSRTIRFRFDGTQTIQPSIRQVSVMVPGRITIHADHTHVLNGEYVHLRGLVRGTGLPPTGKLVVAQALVRGHWRTFATTRTDAAGHWHYEYRFDGTRGHQTYHLRAAIPRESDYPYATGHSKSITVQVRGL